MGRSTMTALFEKCDAVVTGVLRSEAPTRMVYWWALPSLFI